MAEDEPREEPPGEDDPDSDLKTLEGLEEAERRINLESAKLQALFAALKRESGDHAASTNHALKSIRNAQAARGQAMPEPEEIEGEAQEEAARRHEPPTEDDGPE